MLNYETYKTLTPEQKEEYDYKFEKEPEFPLFHLGMLAVFFYLSIMILLMMVFLGMTHEAFEGIITEELFSTIVNIIGNIGMAWFLIFLVLTIEYVFRVARRGIMLVKFKRKHKIKLKRWNFSWN